MGCVCKLQISLRTAKSSLELEALFWLLVTPGDLSDLPTMHHSPICCICDCLTIFRWCNRHIISKLWDMLVSVWSLCELLRVLAELCFNCWWPQVTFQILKMCHNRSLVVFGCLWRLLPVYRLMQLCIINGFCAVKPFSAGFCEYVW